MDISEDIEDEHILLNKTKIEADWNVNLKMDF